LKLIELERVLFLKSKNNLREVVSSKFEEDKIINKINKSSLLSKFLIRFENKIISCCRCNIVTKSSSSLAFTKFKNLSITFVALDCVNKVVDKQVLLF